MTLDEKETNIHYDETDAPAWVETHNQALRNKLRRLMEEYPDECRLKRERTEEGYIMVMIPKRWIKVSPPAKQNLSDEQRKERAERLSRARGIRSEDSSEIDGQNEEF